MIEFLVNCVTGAVYGVFWLAFTAFMIWMIVDCALHESRVGNERLIWVIITVFVPYVGAIAYYVFRRRGRIRAFVNWRRPEIDAMFLRWVGRVEAANLVHEIAEK